MKKTNKKTGSKCDNRVKTSAQEVVKKKKDTVRPTKRSKQMEKEKSKGTIGRGKIKSSSTTHSSDTNKSSDKCQSKESPNQEVIVRTPSADPSSPIQSNNTANQQKSRTEVTKEEISNKGKSVEKEKSLLKTIQKSIQKSEMDEQKKEEKTREKEKKSAKSQPKSEKESEKKLVEKEEKKFNMHLAQLFFKRMMDAQRTTSSQNSNRDDNLEVMPTSIYVPKSTKKHKQRTRKSRPLDKRIFRENGEPVWMISDEKGKDSSKNGGGKERGGGEDGELEKALKEEELQMEDGKQWTAMMMDFSCNKYDDGIIKESVDELNPYDTMEQLEERSDVFFRTDSMTYYTLSNLLTLSQVAMDRFEQQESRTVACRLKEIEQKKAKKEEEEKTCVVTSIRFSMDSTFCISYDRRHPIQSIQKFRQKYQDRLRRAVEKTRKPSKETTSREGSRERTSKEKS